MISATDFEDLLRDRVPLADAALYGAVLSRIGRVELAVTTSMTINVLRRPAPVGWRQRRGCSS